MWTAHNNLGHALFYSDMYIMFSCMDKGEKNPCFEANYQSETAHPNTQRLQVQKNAPHVFQGFTSVQLCSSHLS